MSAADSAQQAARLTDPVGHGPGLLGMLAGALIGAVVGAILIAGAIATGGALLIALAVVAAAGCIAGGGLAGGQLVRGLKTAFGLPNIPTGAVATLGSPNIRIGMLRAARALADSAACSGLGLVFHPPIPTALIAEGAATVRFNNLFAARVSSKLVCGSEIMLGSPTVIIGGPTVRVLDVFDPEEILGNILNYVLIGSLIGAAILVLGGFGVVAFLEFLAIAAAIFAGFEILGVIGDAIGPGWRDILQGLFGLGIIVAGGVRAARGLRGPRGIRGVPEERGVPDQRPAKPAAEEKPSAADELARRRAEAKKALLREKIREAESAGKLKKLSKADQDFLNDDPTGRRKELAYDPDTDSFKPAEARAALQAEQDGTLKGPVERAFDESGKSGGADFIDGEGRPWDVKDARAGADNIADRANAGENVLVDCSRMTPEQQAALQQQIEQPGKLGPGAGEVRFVPKR